jgi:hypothetical protein
MAWSCHRAKVSWCHAVDAGLKIAVGIVEQMTKIGMILLLYLRKIG